MTTPQGITIKGRRVRGNYEVTLLEMFYRECLSVLRPDECDRALQEFSELVPGLTVALIAELYPIWALDERGLDRRFPCVMKDAPSEKVDLNLTYQDARIKLGVEDKHARGGSASAEGDVRALLRIYTLLLRTHLRNGSPVWRFCTDNDLDALTFGILNSYDPARLSDLLREGQLANRRSLAALEALVASEEMPTAYYLQYAIHAGTVWWSHLDSPIVEERQLVINDYARFAEEVLRRQCTLVFMFDDNGELVWDLMLIQRMLAENPKLAVIGVVSTEVVANNATDVTLIGCLDEPAFSGLKSEGRFRVFKERNLRSAIDPSFCSVELFDTIVSADVCFIKGVSFFETIQGLNTTSYYAFVVHSRDSETCTGLRRGDGVFVRVPKGKVAFEYGSANLVSLYDGLHVE